MWLTIFGPLLANRVSYTLSLQTFPRFYHILLSLRFRTACKRAACAPIDPRPHLHSAAPFKRRRSSQIGPSGRGVENTQGAATDGAWEQWAVPLGPGGAGRSLARPPLNLTPVTSGLHKLSLAPLTRAPPFLPTTPHTCFHDTCACSLLRLARGVHLLCMMDMPPVSRSRA